MSAVTTFGTGGAEPYASALQGGRRLTLQPHGRDRRVRLDVARWHRTADDADRSLLAGVRGPVLDVGSGPGRMVRAARELGLFALGIDASAVACDVARGLGGHFVHGSVFEAVPAAGWWQTVLLVDGNIGIGGDVTALLIRCVELLREHGEVIVEVDSDPDHEDRYLAEVVDDDGGRSDVFPWAEIGVHRLTDHLAPVGLELVQSWRVDGRAFCRLATR